MIPAEAVVGGLKQERAHGFDGISGERYDGSTCYELLCCARLPTPHPPPLAGHPSAVELRLLCMDHLSTSALLHCCMPTLLGEARLN